MLVLLLENQKEENKTKQYGSQPIDRTVLRVSPCEGPEGHEE